jgi:hypothetical protein
MLSPTIVATSDWATDASIMMVGRGLQVVGVKQVHEKVTLRREK